MKPATGHAISIYDTGIDVDEIGVIFAGDLPIGALYPLHRAEHAQRLQEAVNSHAALIEAARALKKFSDYFETAVMNVCSIVCTHEDCAATKKHMSEARSTLSELEKAGIL